jgi:Sulfotransferase family
MVKKSSKIVASKSQRRTDVDRQFRMKPPLFILASTRSFTSIVCAMIGQHPQMYGLPETQLCTVGTVGELWGSDLLGPLRFRSGLKRAVAELYFGDQTSSAVAEGVGWLRRRAALTTGAIFEALAEKVYPLTPVEKSGPVTYRIVSMRRMLRMFPSARFLHLTRHPRGHGESNVKCARLRAAAGNQPYQWMFCSPEFARPAAGKTGKPKNEKILDPQLGWMVHNMNICKFLELVPEEQKLRMRGEDLLDDPKANLPRIAEWLKVRADSEALDNMLHPERSPYAFLGPPAAKFGFSKTFLENPKYVPRAEPAHSLEGPLGWRNDGAGFSPEVKELAREFGYS